MNIYENKKDSTFIKQLFKNLISIGGEYKLLKYLLGFFFICIFIIYTLSIFHYLEMLVVIILILLINIVFIYLQKTPLQLLVWLITLILLITLFSIYLNIKYISLFLLIIYIGAIAILFLFVIMLLNLTSSSNLALDNLYFFEKKIINYKIFHYFINIFFKITYFKKIRFLSIVNNAQIYFFLIFGLPFIWFLFQINFFIFSDNLFQLSLLHNNIDPQIQNIIIIIKNTNQNLVNNNFYQYNPFKLSELNILAMFLYSQKYIYIYLIGFVLFISMLVSLVIGILIKKNYDYI